MKIAQGVAGTVKCKGSVSDTLPYLMQAVKQGFQVASCPLLTPPPLFPRPILGDTMLASVVDEYCLHFARR